MSILALRSLVTYLTLATLALLTWWLAGIFTPDEESQGPGTHGKIDYYSKNISRTLMDENGKPKQLLFAVNLTHYVDEDRTELAQPVLTLYGTDGPPWVIHSDTAVMPAEGDTLFLNGNVLILRERDANNRTLKIVTQNARVQPDSNYAETSESIQVLSPPDELTGKGAQVHFGDDLKVTILSDVRRKHEIP
ncbi:LPS export ABC transporter periplasmic protein LptC [Methylocaldum sp.]|uniref:LPS export ABC transporter periplasmic protein LptC n=1 Tax=Methylocaldum sp. TaxID=1969727 RepID=UPI002D4138EE|nr:LPS export ABC transporter periplasmic protein LptC [Methylocaldum sp.]HYE37903.1 LPS export ABC transporter periplasmic protein LptC [Methylocaldum sp.]